LIEAEGLPPSLRRSCFLHQAGCSWLLIYFRRWLSVSAQLSATSRFRIAFIILFRITPPSFSLQLDCVIIRAQSRLTLPPAQLIFSHGFRRLKIFRHAAMPATPDIRQLRQSLAVFFGILKIRRHFTR